jgi:lipopolysaccharide/colanic/teichoic acid biosynthesis glycosyltransferase
MTPTHLALLRRDVSTPETEAIPLPLTPAPQPAAVLVPPVALFAASTVAVAAGAMLGDTGTAPAPWLRAASLMLVVFGMVTIAKALLQGLRPWARRAAHAVVAAGLALALDRLLPGPSVGWAGLGVAAVAGFACPTLWAKARDRLTRRRMCRVSLLAPTDWAALEALERLEMVPWVRVSSVFVPECDPERASRILRRPVAPAARGGPRLERRVVVSCPSRDPVVGGAIAQLVALGHQITSESATIRDAEGRVDSRRADPLNLVLGRPRSHVDAAASRLLDITLSGFLLVLAAPLFLLISLAIVIDGGWPVFYRQRRMGLGGKPFGVLKFRSMRRDAERHTGPQWATENDPRVTRVGRVLRRYRLDELPQLLNVLAGQMALVGPRPERPHFFDVLRDEVPLFDLRTIVRPGITGWAQVRLAYSATQDEARAKLEYDLFYVTRRSPWFDLAILSETVGVVLSAFGSR